jgi:hypothetical protein
LPVAGQSAASSYLQIVRKSNNVPSAIRERRRLC